MKTTSYVFEHLKDVLGKTGRMTCSDPLGLITYTVSDECEIKIRVDDGDCIKVSAMIFVEIPGYREYRRMSSTVNKLFRLADPECFSKLELFLADYGVVVEF